jgi:hypothetical protein
MASVSETKIADTVLILVGRDPAMQRATLQLPHLIDS